MTFNARPSRNSAAGSPSRKTFGLARQTAQWLQTMQPGLRRLGAGVVLACAALVPVHATTPSAEDGFAPGANAQVVASAVQPDGKIIVGGYFTELQTPGQNNPVAVGYVARINPDGSIDTAFNPMANGVVKAVHLQADGKILIGGYFTSLAPNGGPAVARNRIARLNADGTVDTTFNAGIGGTSPSLVHVATIALDSSGRVLIGGEFTTAGPTGGATVPRMRIARLDGADGSLDATFNPAFNNLVAAIAIDSTGRIVVGGGFTTATSAGTTTAIPRRRLARLSAAGVVDAGYDPSTNNLVAALAFQLDGKLLATGNFTSLTPNGGTAVLRNRLVRLMDNGTLDTAFQAGLNADGQRVAVTPDGKIIVSGGFRAVYSTGSAGATRADFIARFAADGSVDTTFFPGPSYIVSTFALQADGKLFIGGSFRDFFPGASGTGIVRRYMARLNEDGSLDASLNPSVDRGIRVLMEQANGDILLGGAFSSIGGITRRSVARMSPTGVVDPGFDPSTNGQVVAIATQSDGKILLGGFFTALMPNGSTTAVTRFSIARVNPDGTLDTGFNPNPNGAVTTIVVQPDGKILVGGTFSTFTPNGATDAIERSGIARLNADGTVDTSFSPAVNNTIAAIVVESDGKILVGGAFSTITTGSTTVTVPGLARLNTDGTVVTTFAPNPSAAISAMRLLASGKILVGGAFTSFAPLGATSSTLRSGIALINADGTLDATFDPQANGPVSGLFVLPDGKILVSGQFSTFKPNGATETVARNFFARLNADGTVDTAFDPNPDGGLSAMLGRSDGGALIAGDFTLFRPSGGTVTQLNKGLARITPTGGVDVSFKPTVGAAGGAVRSLVYQRDGTMIVGGAFASLGGSTTPNMIRMRPEGIVDQQFQAKPVGAVEAIALRALVSDSTTLNQRVGWLESNGSLRTGLNIDPTLIIDGIVEAVTVQGDGKILVGGSFALSGPGSHVNLVRFNTDGSLDTSFKPDPVGAVYDIKVQGDGKIVIGGSFTSAAGAIRNSIARLNSDGTIDSGFNPNPTGLVFALAIQGDNKILLGGTFVSLTPNGAATATPINRLARVNSDGTLDGAFVPNPNNDVSCIAVQSDGKILIGGTFTALQPNGAATATARNSLARINADGTLDTPFDPAPNNQALFILPLSSGKIVVSGFFTGFRPNAATTLTTRNRVAVLNADGTVDAAFDANVDGPVYDVAVESGGSMIISGAFLSVANIARNRIARVSATGALDTTFNPNASSAVNEVEVLSDGSIFAAGSFAGFRIGGVIFAGGAFTEIGSAPVPNFALLSTDGTPIVGAVPTVDGPVRAIAQQTDGRTVIAGDFANVGGSPRGRVARLLADDTLDASFNPGADGNVGALALQDDGKLLLGGTFAMVGGSPHANVARVNTDGTVDAGFSGSTDGAVSAISVQADGKVLVGGAFTTLTGTARANLGRLNADGSIDAGFAPVVNGPVNSIAIQADGSILIGGTFTTVGGAARAGMAKLSSAGAVDPGYDPQPNGAINTLVLAPDGKVIVGGGFSQIGGEPRYLIARLGAATQTAINLGVGSNNTSLNWRRSGSGPEITSATFEFSTDGRTWSTPAAGVRDAGVPGWRADGLALPVNTLFYARARATVAANRGSSTSFIETVRAAYITSSGGSTGGSNEPPEVPARPASFLAETYLSANPELANALYGQPDRLDLAWAHYWTHSRSADTEGIFLPPGGESSVDPKLINLSARSWIGPGEQSLIMGVYIADAPATLLVRALGPSLAAYNITNPVADPAITIYSGQTPIASNDDWAADASVTPQALSEAGVSMNSALDSAMVVTLQPGSYTFVISSKGGTGVGLGELFLLQGQAGRLTNLSARASVGEGGDILIAGFSRVGVGEILVRGLGPDLARHDIVNFLADPFITLHKQSTGTGILANNDWEQVIGAISDKNVRAGALPLASGSKDAAAYMVLGTGGYTIHVSGAQAGQTGVALIELFELR